jgi:hypothetical protein
VVVFSSTAGHDDNKKGPVMPRELIGKTAIALTLVGSIVLSGGQTTAQQAAPNEAAPPALTNGMLTAPGTPTDVDTIPSKFSARTAADDKLPIVAYGVKHLTDEQRRAIHQGMRDKGVRGSEAVSAASYAVVGAEIPTEVALNALYPLPDEVVSGVYEGGSSSGLATCGPRRFCQLQTSA